MLACCPGAGLQGVSGMICEHCYAECNFVVLGVDASAAVHGSVCLVSVLAGLHIHDQAWHGWLVYRQAVTLLLLHCHGYYMLVALQRFPPRGMWQYDLFLYSCCPAGRRVASLSLTHWL